MAFASSQLFTPRDLGAAVFPSSSFEFLLGGSGDGGESFFKAPLPAARRWEMLQRSVSAQAALLIAGNVLVTRLAALSACWLLGKYEAFASEQKERERRRRKEQEQEQEEEGEPLAAAPPPSSTSSERAARRGWTEERGQGLSARLSASALRLLDPPSSSGGGKQGDGGGGGGIDSVPERDEGQEDEMELGVEGGGGEGATAGAAAADADDDDPEARRPAAAASEPSSSARGGASKRRGPAHFQQHHHHHHDEKKKKEKERVRGYTSADVLAQMNQLDTCVQCFVWLFVWLFSFWFSPPHPHPPRPSVSDFPPFFSFFFFRFSTKREVATTEFSLRRRNNTKHNETTHTNSYVLLTTPNVFLFAALARGLGSDGDGSVAGMLPISDFMLFWALLLFFAAPALEQLLIVKGFMRRAIVNAHYSASGGVSDGQLRALWEIATARAARGGGGGGGGG